MTIKKIFIVKYPTGQKGVWGKYEVIGVRDDGMKLVLNALALKDLNTKKEAVEFMHNYRKGHKKMVKI